jgi:integration host factor subunit alpha
MNKTTITRSDLTAQLAEKSGLHRAEISTFIENMLDAMTTALKTNQSIKIPTFGTFSVRQKAARPGRNPRTGETAEISPRRVIIFHPSSKLREVIEDR